MRYHAKLKTDVKLERSIECLGNNLALLEAWGREILLKYPTGKVYITESQPVLIRVISAEVKEDASIPQTSATVAL